MLCKLLGAVSPPYHDIVEEHPHYFIVLKEIQTDVWLAQMIRPVTDASVAALFNFFMLNW
jgi:hypothetical protein